MMILCIDLIEQTDTHCFWWFYNVQLPYVPIDKDECVSVT